MTAWAAGIVVAALALAVVPGRAHGSFQVSFNVKELAEYRLSEPVFRQFVAASQLIVTAMDENPRLASEPLFTRETLLADDAVAAADRLEAQLKFEPRYAAALRIGGLSAREYTRFALALVGAHLAHGFLESGAIRRVPEGAATENVAFIAAHETDVTALLKSLGIDAP